MDDLASRNGSMTRFMSGVSSESMITSIFLRMGAGMLTSLTDPDSMYSVWMRLALPMNVDAVCFPILVSLKRTWGLAAARRRSTSSSPAHPPSPLRIFPPHHLKWLSVATRRLRSHSTSLPYWARGCVSEKESLCFLSLFSTKLKNTKKGAVSKIGDNKIISNYLISNFYEIVH